MKEVAVVDDDIDAARDFARLIRAHTGLKVKEFDSPSKVIEEVRRGKIAILVLDQQMPAMTGTELFKQLRAIDPLARGIMLSGEAAMRDVADALNHGFHRYVAKSNAVADLCPAVLSEYTQYEYSLIDNNINKDQPVVYRKIKWWPFFSITKLRLTRFDTLDLLSVDDSEWENVVTLQPGQRETVKQTVSNSISVTNELELTSQIQGSLGSELGSSAKLRASLESKVLDRFKESRVLSAGSETVKEKSFELAELSPEVPAEERVTMRVVQRVAVKVASRATMVLECSSCKRSMTSSIEIRHNTGRFQFRRIDYFQDGSKSVFSNDSR